MADYDSDSSAGEFTETNVLLGYTSKEAEEDTISKLGGTPVNLCSLFDFSRLGSFQAVADDMLTV
jgi:hypothetical protein